MHTLYAIHDVMKFVHFRVSHFRQSLVHPNLRVLFFKTWIQFADVVCDATFTYGNKNVNMV